MVKKLNRKLLFILVACLFFTLEIILREIGFGDPPVVILDSEIEYYLKPNSSYLRFGRKIEINRYGMRSPNFNKTEQQENRIYLLGDSIVYGNHFLDQGETIAYQLSNFLSHLENKPTCAAIAASSWGPGNILAFYKRFGPFSGEFAFIVQSSHDRVDVPFSSSNLTPYRTNKSYTAFSDFLLFIVEKIFELKDKINTGDGIAYGKKLNATDIALTELIRINKHDIRNVFLVFHPTKSELVKNSQEYNSAHSFYKKKAEDEQIHYINMASEYQNYSINKLYQDDIHLSANGASLFARVLARHIIK